MSRAPDGRAETDGAREARSAGHGRPFGDGLEPASPSPARSPGLGADGRSPAQRGRRRRRGERGGASEPSPGAPTAPAPVSEFRGFSLNPFQVRAVEAIRAGSNVLVSAPTGAGKTLVAEYAILEAVRRGKRCIYTAPIKALSNQKFRDFKADPEIDVGILTGDVTIHPAAQVLVMTTEILRNTIFESPHLLRDVDFVVFDEIHFLDDPERGTVWEESLIFAPPEIRFICLSATVSNARELGEWLEEIRPHAIAVVESHERPVPLTYRLYTERNGTFDLARRERLRKDLAPPARGRRNARGRGPADRQGPERERWSASPDCAPLLDQLQRDGLLPVLVFSFSRKDCERLAYRNLERELLSVEEFQRMRALQAELVETFQLDPRELDGDVFAMARRGIGFHHAGMLPVHKELVERMFTSGLLKLLFTTETFALGINMPARTVVFHSLRKFDGVSFDYMNTRDFMQMAGRAGRQGLDTEGLVYTLLSPRDLAEAPLPKLFAGRPEPVESRFRLSFSSILHLVEDLGRARVQEAWEKSFNHFQHRGASQKERERNRRQMVHVFNGHLALLDELGYLDGDRLTPRGRLARRINGFEIQITELFFRGLLEDLPPDQLAVIFVGLLHEERRPGEPRRVPSRYLGNLRRDVDRLMTELVVRSFRHDLDVPLKRPQWGLTPQALAWYEGQDLEAVAELSDQSPGDLCRTFRMAIQLMRQARRAIDPGWAVGERLAEAIGRFNRDEVDAKRQLELG